jgi:anti-sigma regulatory factor (Ser/Thr protein kinase)
VFTARHRLDLKMKQSALRLLKVKLNLEEFYRNIHDYAYNQGSTYFVTV